MPKDAALHFSKGAILIRYPRQSVILGFPLALIDIDRHQLLQAIH